MTIGKRWKISPNVSFREIEGELLLIHPRSGELWVLNGTGKRIWEMLVAGETNERTIRKLSLYFSKEIKTMAADFAEFITQLESNGFVTRGEE
jgi:hypothetical protein